MAITATANGKTFTFPDGTPPDQMGAAIDEFFTPKTATTLEPKATIQRPIIGQGSRPVVPVVEPVIEQPLAEPAQSRRLTGQASRNNLRRETQYLTNRFEAGEISSADLTDSQVERVRAERVKRIPEISETGFKALSENQGLMQALAGVTTFNEDEFAQILLKADPNIGIVTTPDGVRLAVNRKTNEAVAINKLGPSLIDAIQFGASAGLMTPAGRLSTIPKMALGSAATQAAIETGQAAAGGEFNAEDVAIAGAAVPVVAKAVKGAVSGGQAIKSKLALNKPKFEAVPKDFTPNFPLFGQQSKKTEEIRAAIESGDLDNVTAKYVMDGMGRIKKNKAAIDTIKQGERTNSMQPGRVAAYVGSSKQDKMAMDKMLDVVERGLKNQTYAMKNRPGQVVGDTVLEKYNYVLDVNKKAGQAVSKASENLRNIDVDTRAPLSTFFDELNKIGVKIDADGQLDFAGSSVTSSGETLLKKILPKIKVAQENTNGFQAHTLKKALQKNVEYGQLSVENKLDTDVQRIAKNLATDINDVLRKRSGAYKKANTDFSETIDVINEFRKAAGKNFNVDSPSANEFVGKKMRGLLANIQSREKLMDSLLGLDEVGKKYGAKFDNDIFTQVMFIDDLERTFGTFAPTGIEGVTGKAVAKGIRGDKLGAVADVGGSIIQKARGVNEANALKALRQLVKSK